ncbi:MAG: serine/threonine-protein kinase, partial [Ignavibacteriaceae bacterium]
MIGEIILHYKILENLGEGGMGVVYLAEDTKLKRQVAIKFLPLNISSNEEERKRFEIEAQAAAALNHPNIATIYSIEESDGQMFIVMEYIDGKELKEIIEHKHVEAEYIQTLQMNEVINYATQIAEGLEAAHKKGIIHRDIKSSNILITDENKVKIMDFGLAKVDKSAHLTKVGTTIGTAAYMSPEQARGEEVDKRTDIWSFGIVLYEMLTGELPFKGDYDQAVIYSIMNSEPELIQISAKEKGSEIKQIVEKALRKNPENRYQSMNDILKEFQKILKPQ